MLALKWVSLVEYLPMEQNVHMILNFDQEWHSSRLQCFEVKGLVVQPNQPINIERYQFGQSLIIMFSGNDGERRKYTGMAVSASKESSRCSTQTIIESEFARKEARKQAGVHATADLLWLLKPTPDITESPN